MAGGTGAGPLSILAGEGLCRVAEDEKLNSVCVLGNPLVRANKEPGHLRTQCFSSLFFLVLKVPCVKLAAELLRSPVHAVLHTDTYLSRAGVHGGSCVLLVWQVPGHRHTCGPVWVVWSRPRVWVCCTHPSAELHLRAHPLSSSARSLWLLCAFLQW